eukprot:8781199-Pyramimonas_sp.AAC.1
MQAMLRKPCGALYVEHTMSCKLCGACYVGSNVLIYAVKLCGAIYVVHYIGCELCRAMSVVQTMGAICL